MVTLIKTLLTERVLVFWDVVDSLCDITHKIIIRISEYQFNLVLFNSIAIIVNFPSTLCNACVCKAWRAACQSLTVSLNQPNGRFCEY